MILLFLILQCITGTLTTPELFPYGAEYGDQYLEPNDDSSSPVVQIRTLFPFFNNQHDSLYVDTNGAISFLGTLSQYTPDPFPLNNDRRIVAPYWGDVDIRYGGNVSYRETTDYDLLQRATNEIRNVFPEQIRFHASWIFIATWDNVPFFGADNIGLLKRNTFQCVLITNGRHSFALFLYKNMTWTTGTASGGDSSTGFGGTPAQVGFNAGNSENYFAVNGSRTPDIVNVVFNSNINVPGKFLFRIDTERIEAGGCNTHGSITVTPRYGTMLGGQRIHIGGPCILTDDYIAVRYGENSETYDCLRENEFKVTCVTPMFNRTGDIRVELIIKQEAGTSSKFVGVYSTINVAKVAPVIHRTQPEYWMDGERNKIYWDPTDIPFKDKFVRIDVLYLMETTGRLHWIQGRDCVVCNISVDVAEKSFTLLAQSSVAAIRLTPAGDNNIWDREGVWSDIFYIVWKTNEESEQLCSEWYTNDLRLSLVSYENIQTCPCTIQQALFDTSRFHRDPMCNKFSSSDSDINCIYSQNAEHCVRLNTPGEAGFGRQCCYDNTGNLMNANNPNGAGTLNRYHYLGDNNRNVPFLSNFYYDIVPRQQCCRYRSLRDVNINVDENFCVKYLERRPASDCRGYQPPRPAFANGDPHMKTLDGLSYTFNGAGEFVLLQDIRQNFTTQVRLEQVVDGNGHKKPASVFTSLVAATLNVTDVVEVQLNSIRIADVLINGKIADFDDTNWLDFKGVTVLVTNSSNSFKQFSVIFHQPKVSFQISATKYLLNIVTVVGENSMKGNLTGLLGNFDGNKKNDLVSRNGSLIPSISSLKTIHKEFGESWKINEQDSLFSYPLGKSYASYNKTDFIPNFNIVSLSDVDNHTRDICGDDINCVYDLQTTGITDIAIATKEAMDEFVVVEDSFQPTVFCGKPPDTKNGFWNYSGLSLGNTASLNCYNGYYTADKTILECQNNGNWTSVKVTCIYNKSSGEDKNITELGKLTIYATVGGVSFVGLLLIVCVVWNCHVKRNQRKNEKV